MPAELTGKQRILTALDCAVPDQVPIFELYINESSLVRIAGLLSQEEVGVEAAKDRFGEECDEILDLYCFIVTELGLDATCSSFSIGLQDLGDGTARDKFGTLYRLSEHGEGLPFDGPVKDLSDIKQLKAACSVEADDLAPVQRVMDKVGPDKAHFLAVNDPFKVMWRWRGGMENLLVDYLLDPELVHALTRAATDFNLAVIEKAGELGVDAIIVPGDLAGETTTIMSPDHYREYLKPYHRQMVEFAHQQGLKIVKHSDGNVWPILDDFVEVGFDGIHPIQPQCMDISAVKQHLDGQACIIGNIDCRNLLVSGTPQQVREAVKQTIAVAAPGGGYIISSSNSIHPGCQPENYVAMVQAAHEYGSYTDQ